jgi:preprotein translocase subunit SecA
VSEKLSRILKQSRLEHTILNAKNHPKEAEVIAEAGKRGAITLATNMAGRGTDIKLKEGVVVLGGLHVIGTTRHPSRRIDRQLRGRSGRLGDPGSSQFFVSLEDSLLRLFASPRMTALLQRMRPPEGEPISAKILNKSIETAQKRIEQRNYTMRKHTLEYDDVMNKQRQEVYAFRNELLFSGEPLLLAKEMLHSASVHLVGRYVEQRKIEKETSLNQLLLEHFPVQLDEAELEKQDPLVLEQHVAEKVVGFFDLKCTHQKALLALLRPDLSQANQASSLIHEVMRNLMVRKVDHSWIEHLLAIDHLRTDVHMRTVGQKDPLLEFKHESFALFDAFSRRLRLEMARDLFQFEIVPQPSQVNNKIKLKKEMSI